MIVTIIITSVINDDSNNTNYDNTNDTTSNIIVIYDDTNNTNYNDTNNSNNINGNTNNTILHSDNIRPLFILRIVRPRIFESEFRNHCAKKLVGALRKPTSFMQEFV